MAVNTQFITSLLHIEESVRAARAAWAVAMNHAEEDDMPPQVRELLRSLSKALYAPDGDGGAFSIQPILAAYIQGLKR